VCAVWKSSHSWCAGLALLLATAGAGRPSGAQQPVAGGQTQVAPYRLPSLALVQPLSGGTVPQDKPTVVFRLASGDSTDPVDARSFVASVDGKDMSPAFQIARDEAWGSLAGAPNESASSVTLGAHQLVARVCSIRDACTEISATVTVVASASAAAVAEKTSADRKRTLIDLLLAAAKKLLSP
jgi:hypothetical protein